MKKQLEQNRKIHMGYVLETKEHDSASELSYDDMKGVGFIRLGDKPVAENGDDLNDAPFNCNGSIFDGENIEVCKGDVVIIIKN
jgi:hypothetical protein